MVQHRKTVHEGKKDFACGLCTFKVLFDLFSLWILTDTVFFSVLSKVQPEPARRARAQGAAATGTKSDEDRGRTTNPARPSAAATDHCARSESATANYAATAAAASLADPAAAATDPQPEPADDGGGRWRPAELQDRARHATAAADGDGLAGDAAPEARPGWAACVHSQLPNPAAAPAAAAVATTAAAATTAATASSRSAGPRAESAAAGGHGEAEDSEADPRLQVCSHQCLDDSIITAF